MSEMNQVNRDEVRRQLVESEREHVESIPRFREALKRLFDPDARVSAAAKATLLGVPSRRAFLTVGGATVVGSAALVGCATPKKKQLATTGSTEPPPASTTTTAPGSPETDLILLRTAQSIEVLAVETYATALSSGLLTTPSIADAVKVFQSHHTDHAGLLASATRDLGGTPYDKANDFIKIETVKPALDAATDEMAVVELATTLEDVAAETYVLAGGVLTTPELRAALMSIGATEARHLAVLYGVQQLTPVPLPVMPTRNAAPPDSYIGPDGPVKIPEPPTTTTTTAA